MILFLLDSFQPLNFISFVKYILKPRVRDIVDREANGEKKKPTISELHVLFHSLAIDFG